MGLTDSLPDQNPNPEPPRIITSRSSGIGLALAHQVGLEGERVSILARSLNMLEQVKQAICLPTSIYVAVFAIDVVSKAIS
ncbi:hypothetical protein ACB098_02G024100 [Castanea mollissima]